MRPSSASNLRSGAFVLLAALFLVACSENATENQNGQAVVEPTTSTFEMLNPQLSASAKELVLAYARQIGSDFALAGTEIEELLVSIQRLLDDANEGRLAEAREAWLDAHGAYELTALHRYFATEIFNDQNSSALFELQYQINHWPIVPGYIDYVSGYPDSGIVHDINVNIDSASLRAQHGSFDVSEVSLGFHVIEFLLWGESADVDTRPATDYIAVEQLTADQTENGYTLEQLGNNRRRLLLGVVAAALVEDFRALQSLWLAQAPETQHLIESTSGTDLIVVLADSMSAMLTEELLLRSLYPMLNGELVESVQSPYSRSTEVAVSSQLSGLERLLLESQTEDGTTLDLVFSAISDEFSEFFYQNFDASKSCLVLLYGNSERELLEPAIRRETEIVECINLLTNMIDYNERLKFDLID